MGGRSDPAYVELMPIPTINKAMASVDAAVAKNLATAVRLNIVIVPSQIVIVPSQNVLNSQASRLDVATSEGAAKMEPFGFVAETGFAMSAQGQKRDSSSHNTSIRAGPFLRFCKHGNKLVELACPGQSKG